MAAFVPKAKRPPFQSGFSRAGPDDKTGTGPYAEKVSLFLPDGGGVHRRFRSGYPAGHACSCKA